jgi:hypothetical protein
MQRYQLQRLLGELRQTLTDILSTENITKAGVEALKKEVEKAIRQLDQTGEQELDQETLRARLKEALSRFEATHPTLTSGINNILNTLSGSGV